MVSKETFTEISKEFDILDYIERTLKLLHANSEKITGKKDFEIV